MSLPAKVDLAHAYADQAEGDHYVGVTGPGPARLAQFDEIENALPLVELGTVLAIALVVGITFRSFGAPLLTLVASGISFLVASGLIPKVADRLGAGIPQEVEPLVVALTLGVVTDYTVFFLSACRRELAEGAPRVEAAKRSCTAVAPIVATAGLIVVAGSAALLVGELEFFRAFGPALALTAGIALAVSITFVPAALALFGRVVFWPSLKPGEGAAEDEDRPSPLRSALAEFLTSQAGRRGRRAPHRGGRSRSRPRASATPSSHCGSAAGSPPTRRCARPRVAADRGFAAGVLAPTIVLVEGNGVGAAARRGWRAWRKRSTRCPASRASSGRASSRPRPRGTCSSPRTGTPRASWSSSTRRRSTPRRSRSCATSTTRLPGRRSAGRPGSRRGRVAHRPDGDRLRHGEAIVDSSALVGAVVLAVNFLLLALFLRALVAPLYLLAASVLSVAATLGLTTYVFQGLLGHSDLTYYVPFAAGVLLVSLGLRLQRLRRRAHLAGGGAAPAARGDRSRRAAGLARDQRRRHRARRLVRDARHRPDRRLPRASRS